MQVAEANLYRQHEAASR